MSGHPKISIIVPTHNRVDSLERLLTRLNNQSVCCEEMEVIVVADGCSDGTKQMVQAFPAGYDLLLLELPGNGAATARNSGAQLAQGEILLFIDDDIEPSHGLVEAHINCHHEPKRVAIGYLPFTLKKNAGLFDIILANWWEDKYEQMNTAGYRYSFEDLLSGNFSVSKAMFDEAGGFDTAFLCREDYELGARLMVIGASFRFCKDAWGYHRDTVTDLERSLHRKKMEGRFDVMFVHKHPELSSRMRLASISFKTLMKRLLLYFVFYFPAVTDWLAKKATAGMRALEKKKLRNKWKKRSMWLHNYWYIRGVAEATKDRTTMRHLISNARHKSRDKHKSLTVDLKQGLRECMSLIDSVRPETVQVMYGEHQVGTIPHVAGSEKLRGEHLLAAVPNYFTMSLVSAMSLDRLMSSSSPANHDAADKLTTIPYLHLTKTAQQAI